MSKPRGWAATPALDRRADRALRFVAIGLSVGLAAWHMARFTVVLDDAYIALRVASNWAHFGAPEYNPGVHEWVPTSFLWVGLVAAASKLVPGGDCVWIARVLGGL